MRKPVAIAVAATFCAAAPAAALPLPGTNLEVNANATLMSDYRFRGVSRSDEDPALQGQLTLTHGSGFYTGARATTLDGLDGFRLRDPDFQELGDLQLDLYAGYSADIGRGFLEVPVQETVEIVAVHVDRRALGRCVVGVFGRHRGALLHHAADVPEHPVRL